jgi:hypothetical protein
MTSSQNVVDSTFFPTLLGSDLLQVLEEQSIGLEMKPLQKQGRRYGIIFSGTHETQTRSPKQTWE